MRLVAFNCGGLFLFDQQWLAAIIPIAAWVQKVASVSAPSTVVFVNL